MLRLSISWSVLELLVMKICNLKFVSICFIENVVSTICNKSA